MKRQALLCTVAISLAAALILAGCGGDSGNAGQGLEGVTWKASRFSDGMGGLLSPVAGSELTALFEEGTVSGFSGVNTFSGSCEVEGDRMTIGALATTLMAGEPELMDQEAAYIAALQSAASLALAGGRLELYDGGGQLVVSFEPGG